MRLGLFVRLPFQHRQAHKSQAQFCCLLAEMSGHTFDGQRRAPGLQWRLRIGLETPFVLAGLSVENLD